MSYTIKEQKKIFLVNYKNYMVNYTPTIKNKEITMACKDKKKDKETKEKKKKAKK